MCWDRIVEVETPERKRKKEPAHRKIEKRLAAKEPTPAPLTQDIPVLVESS